MIFQHTIDAVLSGRKTQTCRLVKSNERALLSGIWECTEICTRTTSHFRTKWRVGSTYAASPGRGRKSVARIRILRIRKLSSVTELTPADILREAVGGRMRFMELWRRMHGDKLGPVWVIRFELVEQSK